MKKLWTPTKKLITRRSLLKTAGIAAPAIITLPRLADAQFGACLPGFCGASLGPCSPTEVVLQVPFDGTNGSTVMPDVSTFSQGNGTVAGGGATLDTSNKQFGTASVHFNGASCVSWNASGGIGPFWVLGTQWCIECFVFWGSSATDQAIMGQFTGIGFGTESFMFFTEPTQTLRFFVYDGVGFPINITTATGVFTTSTWYYYCVESDGTKVRMYAGLGSGGTAAVIASQIPTDTNCGSSATNLAVGACNDGIGRPMLGNIDMVRVTKNCFRYGTDSPIPVPTAAFPIP